MSEQVRHTTFARMLHWGFVGLYIYGIVKQVNDLEDLEEDALLVFEAAFASVFLLIVIIRYSYMKQFEAFLGATAPIHLVHRRLARSVHLGMYGSFVLLPVSGLMIAALYTQGHHEGHGTMMAWTLAVHSAAASLSYILIAVHVAAAVYSRLKGEGVWSSMVPVLEERGPTTNEMVMNIALVEERCYDTIERLMSRKPS